MTDTSNAATPKPPHQQTTPLGGSTHRATRPVLSRHWSGYVPVVRRCPSCGHENPSGSIFCPDCGADLRNVELTAATSERPGIQIMRARLLSDARKRDRTRGENQQGGGGWLLLSLFLLLPAIMLSSDSIVKYGLWSAGIASALFGLWKIRRDSGSIRGWGVFFGILTVITFVYLGNQVLQHRSPANLGANVTSTPPPASEVAIQAGGASTPATGKITTDVLAFRGDSAHSGQQPGPAPASNLKLAWRFDTGGEVYSTPVIAKGVLYAASKNGFLYALNAETGQEIWRFQLSAYVVRSSPAVANGVVYIGAGFNLFAIDARNGTEVWRVALRYAGQSTPTIAGGIVVVPSQEGWLYALSAKDGALRWRIPTDGVVFGAAAIANNIVTIGTDNGTVYAIKLDNGQLLWRNSVSGGVIASPSMAGNVVYFTSDSGKTYAFDLAEGNALWAAEIGGPQPSAVTDQRIVVASTDGGIHAVDKATGAAAWLYPTGKPKVAAPVVTGQTIFVGAGNSLLALDASTGKLKSYFLANADIETSPTVVDGFVFFGSSDGFIYAVTSST